MVRKQNGTNRLRQQNAFTVGGGTGLFVGSVDAGTDTGKKPDRKQRGNEKEYCGNLYYA